MKEPRRNEIERMLGAHTYSCVDPFFSLRGDRLGSDVVALFVFSFFWRG
jgi:hypothetical protein